MIRRIDILPALVTMPECRRSKVPKRRLCHRVHSAVCTRVAANRTSL